MSSSKLPSPARSQGSLVTPRLSKPKRTRSVGSPARSTASGRLSALVQFNENNKDSFVLSPAPSRRSVLNDDTDIEEPRRKSWWKNLGENSRDVMEVLNDNKILETNEAVEEFIDIEVLSQEKKNYTIDLPESSDSESISSIVIPQRKLFTQKDLQAQNKFGQLIGTRETLAKLHKTNVADKTVIVAPKNLFGQNTKVRDKPVFPAGLLNISPNKTANKTKELAAAEVKVQVKSLFGNRAGTKRKNMFADFIVSESEDEISDIQPKVFGFPKKAEQRRDSSASRGKREHSPTSSITIEIEMDEWQHLPSSTMVENQLEDMLTARTPVKRARLSQLAETKESQPSQTIAEHEKESEDEQEELKYDDDENQENELNSEKDMEIAQNRSSEQYFNENNVHNVSKNKELNRNRMGIECEIVQLAQEVNKSKTEIQNISKMTIENIKPSKVDDGHISRNLSKNRIQEDEVDNNLESQKSFHSISKTRSHTLNKSKSRNVSQNDIEDKAKEIDQEDNVGNLKQMDVGTDEVPIKDKDLNHDIIKERTNGAEEKIIGKEVATTENKVLKAVIDTDCVTPSEAPAQNQIKTNINQKENQNHTMNMEEMQVENEGKPQEEIESEEREDNDEEGNEKSMVSEELVETEVEEEEEHEETELDYEADEEEAELVLAEEDQDNTEVESEEEEQVDDPKEEVDQNELNEIQSLEKFSEEHETSQARGQNKSEMEKHEENEIIEQETSNAKENLEDEIGIQAEVQESEVEVQPMEEYDDEAVEKSNVEDQDSKDEVQIENENEAESDDEAQNESQGGVQNESKDKVQNESEIGAQIESEVEAQDESEVEAQDESQVEVQNEKEDEIQNESEMEVQNESEVEAQDESQVEVQNEKDDEIQNESEMEVQNESEIEAQIESEVEAQDESEVEAQDESQVEVQNEKEDEIQNESEMEVQNESEVEAQDESQVEVQNEKDDEIQNESEMEVQNESEIEAQIESEVEAQDESEVEAQDESQVEVQNEKEDEIQNESEMEVQNESEVEAQGESEDEAQNESEIKDQNESEDEEQNESDELQYDNETEEEDQIESNVDAQDASEDEIEDSNDLDKIQQSNHAEDSPNQTHDTTGRYRKKLNSPEAILHDKTNQNTSFTPQGRNTSIRKTTMLKNMNVRPSLAPLSVSTGLSDGTTNSSAEGSGWDSHRTTRKTMRQTFGKDFTPRKSLRALVMEKSAKEKKRQTAITDLTSVTSKFPQANSTEFPEGSMAVDEENLPDAVHDVSKRTRQTTLEMYLQKIKKQNLERKIKMEEAVKNSLKVPARDHNPFKLPSKPLFSLRKQSSQKLTKPKARTSKSTMIPLDDLPQEVIEDMKYKPPKRFQPSNASWITKRLYKFLESKLESKYDYKARVRAEKLVSSIYKFAKDLRRHDVAPTDAVDELKHEMARLDVVKTHFDFYQFFHDYMPREIRVKVVPDVVNKIGMPKHGVFSDILRGNNVQG